jgi:hypothetical protein
VNLHITGDCHSHFGWRKIGEHIGLDRNKLTDMRFDEIRFNGAFPITAGGFGIHKLEMLDISKSYTRATPSDTMDPEFIPGNYPYSRNFDIKNGDGIVFCIGEIDRSTHLGKSEFSDIWQELIDEMVLHYFEAIKVNVEQFNNLYTMIFNIIPVLSDISCASPGTKEHRKTITLYFNNKLKEYCEKYNYIFFDVYDKYCDKDGYLNPTLAYTSHLNDPIYLIEFLKNLSIL